MKTQSALLKQTTSKTPFAKSKPLSIETVDLAEPSNGEVLVKIMAAGLCQSDVSVMKGGIERPLPIALGHEAAGVIVKVGPNVTGLKSGDKVITTFVPSCGKCLYCSEGRPALCEPGNISNSKGSLFTGNKKITFQDSEVSHHVGVSAFSQHAVISENSVVKVDTNLPFEYLALLGCSVVTGVGAAINAAKIKLGESVAILGLGGVGFSSLLGSIAAGASKIIAIDINENKLKMAQTFGNVEVYTPEQISNSNLLELNNGVDAVIETAGVPAAIDLGFELAKRGGRIITTGLPSSEKRFELPLMSLTFQEKEVKGSYLGSCVPKRDIPNYIKLCEAGTLPIDKLLTKTITLEEINEGFDMLTSGEHIRIVIKMD